MKTINTTAKILAALAISASCAMPVMAQNTMPNDTNAQNNAATTTTTTERVADNDRDYGWLGLLGLAGLLGLRRKAEDHRTSTMSPQR